MYRLIDWFARNPIAAKISCIDQQRIVNITDTNKQKVNMSAVIADLQPWLNELLKTYLSIYNENP
jgi:hypothetical protein